MAEQITSAKATAKTVRTSPRKARLVIDLIRGKSVADAISILKFTPNKSAGIIEKVLMSAVANAVLRKLLTLLSLTQKTTLT